MSNSLHNKSQIPDETIDEPDADHSEPEASKDSPDPEADASPRVPTHFRPFAMSPVSVETTWYLSTAPPLRTIRIWTSSQLGPRASNSS